MSNQRDIASVSGAVSVATTSTAVIGANPSRQELSFFNDGANVIYLEFQTDPATLPTAVANQGVRLAAGGSYTTNVFRGAVAGIAMTGATVLTVIEL